MHGPHPGKDGLGAHKSAGMLRHLRGVCLLVLWLAAGGRALQITAQREGCQTPESAGKPPCPAMRKWMSLVSNVDQGIKTSDNETILEGPHVLGKIKGTPEYGCILKQIFEFYAKVLAVGQRKGGNYTDLSHLLGRLKRCLLKVHCPGLCKKINRQAKKQTVEVDNVSDLSPRQLAMFQIQKLQGAKRRLAKDLGTLEKAIVELKGLQFYDSNAEVRVGTCPTKAP
ncbi:uncharacterized protein LOC118218836 [Anguilla anguilla]|uniref:uncharacterized protein LOC118218836 n=1 Tax=Anguilla anguilla TaxID=7936 RepID=UPI0015B0410C|nr:uncharacterized protein LOC118218836 [Anguilla anguilla]